MKIDKELIDILKGVISVVEGGSVEDKKTQIREDLAQPLPEPTSLEFAGDVDGNRQSIDIICAAREGRREEGENFGSLLQRWMPFDGETAEVIWLQDILDEETSDHRMVHQIGQQVIRMASERAEIDIQTRN